jgi:hypothetical protein
MSRPFARTSITRPHYFVAALAFVVELLYLWIAAEALLFWPVHGAFFAVVAIGQGSLGVKLLFSPGRWTLRLGILFNVSIIVLWGLARAIEAVFPVWILAVRSPFDGLEYTVIGFVLSLLISLIWLLRSPRSM